MTDAPAVNVNFKATTIGHADHLFLSPLSAAKADWLIKLLDLAEDTRVLDIGCGKAGFLRRLLKQTPTAHGTGVDINSAFLAEAASAAAHEDLTGRLKLVNQPAASFLAGAHAFDVVLCFGASQAVGGFDAVTAAARAVLSPGGLFLVGEGFWRRAPDVHYLAVLGASPDELTGHAENAARLRAAGFNIAVTATASDNEWDEYEGLYCRAKIRWSRRHPEDPDAAPIAAAAQEWHDAYLRWGRDTLGFGWYLGIAV